MIYSRRNGNSVENESRRNNGNKYEQIRVNEMGVDEMWSYREKWCVSLQSLSNYVVTEQPIYLEGELCKVELDYILGTRHFGYVVLGSFLFLPGLSACTGWSELLSTVNIEGKAHAGNATQNIHPPLVQKTRIHIQPPHTLHHSYIN